MALILKIFASMRKFGHACRQPMVYQLKREYVCALCICVNKSEKAKILQGNFLVPNEESVKKLA